jgi:hypothetical protein
VRGGGSAIVPATGPLSGVRPGLAASVADPLRTSMRRQRLENFARDKLLVEQLGRAAQLS